MKLRRFIPRYSLRTLAIFPLLATSACGLWRHRAAYYRAGRGAEHGRD